MQSLWQENIQLFDQYLQFQRGLSLNSRAAYRRDVNKLVAFLRAYSPMPAPLTVSANHLETFVQTLAASGQRTQMRTRAGIQAFYRFLVDTGQLHTTPPTTFLQSSKRKLPLPTVLSIAEITQLLAAIDDRAPQGLRDRALVEVLYGTGLRVSELTDLQLGQVYFEEDLLRVQGKGSRERLVPLGEVAKQQLLRYMEITRKKAPQLPKHKGYVFLSHRGKQLSRITVFETIKALAKKAGLPATTSPHTLRHSFASHLLAGGASLATVQILLGHANPTTTALYTHLDQDHLEEVVETCHPYNIKMDQG